MKRSAVGLAEIADWHTLAAAFHHAARGKGRRDEVRCFRAALMDELSGLRRDILDGTVAVGHTRRFRIRDPKPRVIHAPCFRERVLHHAVMAHAGPVLERGLVDDTFACRPGKGTLAAVRRAAHHADRFPWYGQIDIRSYFAGIDHVRLLRLLARRFKDAGLLALFARIVDAHHDSPGKGLPIGALTSQHFANAYLGGLDRFLLERCKVRGMVRTMDDLVWWGDDKAAVRAAMADVRHSVGDELDLAVKEPVRIGRSRLGLAFCRYRVVPGASPVAAAEAALRHRAPPVGGGLSGRAHRRAGGPGRMLWRPGHHRPCRSRGMAAGASAPPASCRRARPALT
ncbi:RNA-directed DNA polymerase [Azospirillum brasilense]|uniref:RNA-directed DNA polymerase n=1 Tax=Azospirillum brasilense TaxID=192 RepID=UPI000E0A6E8D|nr:RNA-directed DNA polymerase [Azospirillum brasilense]